MPRPSYLLLAGCLAIAGYLSFAPVPIAPKAFVAPPNEGFTGPFAPNEQLAGLRRIELSSSEGPEDGALAADGTLYISLRNGNIVRMKKGESTPSRWVNTGGAPLGLEFGPDGVLWVADAYRGLLSIGPDKQIQLRSDAAGGVAIRYADDVDVTPDGLVYFTDASTKFGAQAFGGTLPASLLDTVEHGRYGRLLRYDPRSDSTTVVRGDLAFANGVAIDDRGENLYLAETGENRVLALTLSGARAGHWRTLRAGLPGFPDNVEMGRGGRIWVGLVAPRNSALDATSQWPRLRAMSQRLPEFMRLKPAHYGHLIALNNEGEVLLSLQDPSGAYSHVTGAVETERDLFVTSLKEAQLGRLAPPSP